MPAAEAQGGEPLASMRGGEKRALLQQEKGPNPRQTAVSHLQATCPIHSYGIRIRSAPVRPLFQNLSRKLVVTRKPICFGEDDKVLMAVQLPSNL